jgi:hypothetical protein
MDIREKLGLLPNTVVEFEIDGDAVRITRSARGTRSRGREIVEPMRGRGTGSLTTDQIMKLMRG